MNEFEQKVLDRLGWILGIVVSWTIVAVVLMIFVGVSQAQSNPLPLGSVQDNGSTSCSGFQKGSTCESLTISCTGAAPINVTVGTVLGTNGKTILYANGSTWTIPGGGSLMSELSKYGYTTVEAAWASPGWQSGPGNMLTAACRTSTLFNYVANGSTIALAGGSGGAGAIGYALSQYGLANEIVGAWLTSGPVYSDLSQGCETPKMPQVTVTASDGYQWESNVYYSAGVPPLMSSFTGQTCEPKTATSGTVNTDWLDQSILAPGFQNYFPTYLYVQLCASAAQPNNSSGQGYLWLQQILSPWTLEAVLNCAGSEGTSTGYLESDPSQTGLSAEVADIEAHF